MKPVRELRWIADYRCKPCRHTFSVPAGPEFGKCPRCGNTNLEWLNFETLKSGKDKRTVTIETMRAG